MRNPYRNLLICMCDPNRGTLTDPCPTDSATTLAALTEGTLVYNHRIGDILPACDSCVLT